VPVPAPGTTPASAPWFIGGISGVTFGTAMSSAVAGQFGIGIRPNLFVIGEVGRMQNVMPKDIRDQLDDAVDELEATSGLPVTVELSLPATYGFGGVRWVSLGQIAPFIEAGAGVGHIALNVKRAQVLGQDFTDEIKDELGSDASETKFLFAVGGGVTASLGRATSIDAGYRFTRIETEGPAINASMLYVGIKVRR
ncbi:MAG: hypothetical protein ABI652_05590, partial [Acidobacteriota bacterium]